MPRKKKTVNAENKNTEIKNEEKKEKKVLKFTNNISYSGTLYPEGEVLKKSNKDYDKLLKYCK